MKCLITPAKLSKLSCSGRERPRIIIECFAAFYILRLCFLTDGTFWCLYGREAEQQ